MFIPYVNFPGTPVDDPDALNMNGGQTIHGGQIGENIHNQAQNPIYHQYYGKRTIGKCKSNPKYEKFV